MTDLNFNQDEDNALDPGFAVRPISTSYPDPRGKNWGWLTGPRGLLIGLGLGLGLAFIAMRATTSGTGPAETVPAAQQTATAASVTTARARSAAVNQTITANGTVEAVDLLSVSPRANGLQIQSVLVREGDRVGAGQLLATLDDAVLQAQIDQAQAQVNAAEAQVVQARAQAAQARASLAEAQDQFDRYQSLFNQGAISEEELFTRQTQVTTQTQAASSAAAAIQSAEAAVRSSQAEVNRLTAQLDQTQVLAPASGIVAESNATIGDSASSGTPLFKLISDGQLELAVKVPQSQLAQVNVGTPVQIRSSSDKNLQLQGSVRSIDPTVDAQTRQATVKVGLPGSDRLRPGMFLQANIVTDSRRGVVIPADALLPQASGGFVVYTLNADGTVKAQPVDVGKRIPATGDGPEKIEITSGLAADTPVVVEGASYLQDGDRVNVVGEGN